MKKKVAVVYPFIPHYRNPVFSEMGLGLGKADYVFFSGKDRVDPTIKNADASDAFRWVETSVFQKGNLIWQCGVFRACIGREFTDFVFLGNPYYASNWVYAVLARLSGKKVYFWTHGWLSVDPFPKRLLRSFYYRLSNGLLLYGDRARKIGIGLGFDRSRLHVIYNSLNYPAQRMVRSKLEALDDSKAELPVRLKSCSVYVACIARLTHECKFEMAIDALAILSRKGQGEIPLVLIGDGPARVALERYAVERGVEVIFLGELYGEEQIGPVLYNARVVISPGKVGLTAMHSLAYGTPVITHGDFERQGPEFEAIKDGVNGSFFSVGSVLELSEKISLWIHRTRTAAERIDCYSIVEERYTPAKQVEFIERAIF